MWCAALTQLHFCYLHARGIGIENRASRENDRQLTNTHFGWSPPIKWTLYALRGAADRRSIDHQGLRDWITHRAIELIIGSRPTRSMDKSIVRLRARRYVTFEVTAGFAASSNVRTSQSNWVSALFAQENLWRVESCWLRCADGRRRWKTGVHLIWLEQTFQLIIFN